MGKRPAMLNIDLGSAMYKMEEVREDIDRYELGNTFLDWWFFDGQLEVMIERCKKMKEEDVGDDW